MLMSVVEEVSKSKKTNRLKIPGIEEDRQMGPRIKDKRGRKKKDRTVVQEGKPNHKETKRNRFLVDPRHCCGI